VSTIAAHHIVELLAQKHSKDVFVSECKDGPSSGGMLKMDGWAMKRSWANPCFYGYEIKVSRSDFMSDTKWPGYLNLCNEFYFVCPNGVIKPEELSKDVGLLIVAKTGTRLFTKKKAPYRNIETPDGLLLYILMCRAKVVKSTYYVEQEENKDYWSRWLADKNAKLDLGTSCSRKLRKSYEEQVYNAQRDLKIMKAEMEAYKPVKEICKELKLNPHAWRFEESFRKQIENLQQLTPPEVLEACNSLETALDNFKKLISVKSDKDQSVKSV